MAVRLQHFICRTFVLGRWDVSVSAINLNLLSSLNVENEQI
jgi:hypothetical protein